MERDALHTRRNEDKSWVKTAVHRVVWRSSSGIENGEPGFDKPKRDAQPYTHKRERARRKHASAHTRKTKRRTSTNTKQLRARRTRRCSLETSLPKLWPGFCIMLSFADVAAPLFSRSSTILACPLWQARCNGVLFQLSLGSTSALEGSTEHRKDMRNKTGRGGMFVKMEELGLTSSMAIRATGARGEKSAGEEKRQFRVQEEGKGGPVFSGRVLASRTPRPTSA